MLMQDSHLKSRSITPGSKDDFQHVLIPACELGVERYCKFREENPSWQPKLYVETVACQNFKLCEGCQECVSICRFNDFKRQLIMECTSPLKGTAKPYSLSNFRPINQFESSMEEDAMPCQTVSLSAVNKAIQQYQNKGTPLEETIMPKPPIVSSAVKEKPLAVNVGLKTKSDACRNHPEGVDLGVTRSSEFGIIQGAVSEHGTSSDDFSEDPMTASQMDDVSFSDQSRDKVASAKTSDFPGSLKAEVPMSMDDEDMSEYVLATHQIPHGRSFSNLSHNMQKRLHDHFRKTYPTCPYCNSNSYVRFRYFNNSGKSSLLQPRYSCRNPNTCLAVQEKGGKSGSRDFTLPKPKEVEIFKEAPMPSSLDHSNGLHGRSMLRPQMIACYGVKRPSEELGLSEGGEKSRKLPNTTLSLQPLNQPASDISNMQSVAALKEMIVAKSGKPSEDSNSSSSIQIANDEQTTINLRCRAEASSDNGRLVVHPMSLQKMVSTSGKEEGTSTERSSKGGKIAELNIRMLIDLSSSSLC
ncbi:hypothetical protein KP509_39G002600 [Ceratopteris richardii]|uniref:Uncharacterized protein n=1 Tax=Ceratopteris richardii TaxID=49495 RepID=A0A8T2PXZ5_CERRI|nr:hypothetical protein KP509_39G002600 [Ceratopteris richardii]KAH7276319.1 hypothetical protein KP509_39G002600 [Ceratopteris richardii]KAH7276320.1 hypothetical protein KP509_39G002600 [Ceratopteris richardii]